MNQEEKMNLDLDMMKQFRELVDSDKRNAVLYMRADTEYHQLTVDLEGDSRILASAFHHHMDNEEEFRRFMFATIGSYISCNSEYKKEFLAGLNMTERIIGN